MKNQQNIELTKIRQIFKNNKINDLEKNIINELEKIDKSKLNNKRLAIAVGSRGINNLSRITRIVTDFLKQNGAKPFIFPAMGSHGGATDEGQKKVLHTLGIDEKTMNCPVISSMETIKTGETSKNVPL